jgi:hypothetical protein
VVTDDTWWDVWGICYNSRFCHAEYRIEAEAKAEFDRLTTIHPNFKGEIIHIPRAGYGNMRYAGFGAFMPYDDGRKIND